VVARSIRWADSWSSTQILNMPSILRENWSLTKLSLLDAPAEGKLRLVDGLGCLVVLLALAALDPEKAPVAALLAALLAAAAPATLAAAALVGTCIITTITTWFRETNLISRELLISDQRFQPHFGSGRQT
jgi:hypothetical protein